MSGNEYNLMVKQASPFVRRMLELLKTRPGSLKKMRITPAVYQSFLSSPEYNGAIREGMSRSEYRRIAREYSRLRRGHMPSGHIVRTMPELAKSQLRSNWMPTDDVGFKIRELNRNGINSVYDLLTYDNTENLREARRIASEFKSVGGKRKSALRMKSDANAGLSRLPVDKNISSEEFERLYPDQAHLFKGGLYTRDWPIDDPGWFSGHKGVSYGYTAQPTGLGSEGVLPYITVARRSDSGALRSGRTFFTPHVASGNRRERINFMKNRKFFHDNPTTADQFPDYEVVLPGNDIRNLPTASYRVVSNNGAGFGDVRGIMDEKIPFSTAPVTFQRIADQGSFNRHMRDLLQSNRDMSGVVSGYERIRHRLEPLGSFEHSHNAIDSLYRMLYRKRRPLKTRFEDVVL